MASMTSKEAFTCSTLLAVVIFVGIPVLCIIIALSYGIIAALRE